jgi:hypothetical protein
MDRGVLKTLFRLIQTRPAGSLLMRLPLVGPRGYRETPYSVHNSNEINSIKWATHRRSSFSEVLDALDSPLWKVPNKARARALSLYHFLSHREGGPCPVRPFSSHYPLPRSPRQGHRSCFSPRHGQQSRLPSSRRPPNTVPSPLPALSPCIHTTPPPASPPSPASPSTGIPCPLAPPPPRSPRPARDSRREWTNWTSPSTKVL